MKLNTTSLAAVEAGYPILAEQMVIAKFTRAEVKPNKAQTGNNLVLECQIQDLELIRLDGSTYDNTNKLKYRSFVSLTPTESRTEEMINRDLKRLQLAIGMPEDAEDIGTDDLLSHVVQAKLSYSAPRPKDDSNPSAGMWPEGNNVENFQPLPEDYNGPGL